MIGDNVVGRGDSAGNQTRGESVSGALLPRLLFVGAAGSAAASRATEVGVGA